MRSPIFEETEKGWIWAHAYQFDDQTATFIVECSQDTFDAFGFADISQQDSIALCEEIFKAHLGGHSHEQRLSYSRLRLDRFPRFSAKNGA